MQIRNTFNRIIVLFTVFSIMSATLFAVVASDKGSNSKNTKSEKKAANLGKASQKSDEVSQDLSKASQKPDEASQRQDKDTEKSDKDSQESEKAAEKRAARDKQREEDRKLQDKILRKEVMTFVKENQHRSPGEGWLYLAKHYKELRQEDRSLMYLRTLLRSEHINPRIVWDAMLLRASIYNDRKEFDSAIKELDKLIAMQPARIFMLRAKIDRAKIFGRSLTTVEELFKAFKRYYWTFPEKPDVEAIEYLMGFERGYDLEIAMKALEAWEEISRYPEGFAADLANMHIALLYAFDLNAPKRSLPFLNKIVFSDTITAETAFVKAVIGHFYIKDSDQKKTLENYTLFRKKTEDINGFRIAGILQGQLLGNIYKDYASAIETLSTLIETPPHLVASESISVEQQWEDHDEEIDWALLATRMAGYIAEFNLNNPERARYFYQKYEELNKERSEPIENPYINAAMERTKPSQTEAQILFSMAYEKYRSRELKEALSLYEEFIKKYSSHSLYREALFRTAVMVDDDLKQYARALEMYERFLIKFVPIKSSWSLDVLYDWGRIDEVRYRIGNLQSLHLRRPVAALEIFAQLAKSYPDSYWAMQGLKDSINIYQNELGEIDKANELRQKFIETYPESKEASDFRLYLYKIFLAKGDQIKALHTLRDYLDHTLPSEKDYFSLKQQWRDLAFKIREESLRKLLETAGAKDRVIIYQNLVDVFCLASGSTPLEGLTEEIKASSMQEETRWSLVYDAATRMYQTYPDKAAPIFTELVNNATGSARIAGLLTLGNIAYRVDKKVGEAIKWYELAEKLLPLTDSRVEIPAYRLGRLYLAQGDGLKGLEKLRLFTVRFSRSRYLAKAYKAMGDACVALNCPEIGIRYYKRVLRIAPTMADSIKELILQAEKMPTSQEWLVKRALERLENAEEQALEAEDEEKEGREEKKGKEEKNRVITKLGDIEELTEEDLEKIETETIYEIFLTESQKEEPDLDRIDMYLYDILMRADSVELQNKAMHHLVSMRIFRFRDAEVFTELAKKILIEHNYAEWQSELLFRLAQAYGRILEDYEEANKAYFEYLSFYPSGKRFLEIRRRIPEVYALAEDKKNARRFFDRLVDDSTLTEEIRVDASIKLAMFLIKDEKKDEAIRTLEASLAFKSDKKPEICLHLEKLTEDFDYVSRALEAEGEEAIRFKALKRLVKKAEEDETYSSAAEIIRDFSDTFKEPEAKLWIEKKVEELGKRGVIGEIEDLIDRFPEEPETVGRMFRLAKMVEGAENTRYRAEDLFYEITLVYPDSEYFRESRIRAENTRAIKAVSELSDMLKTGVNNKDAEEILIERARLFKESLKDNSAAIENYESFVSLFPNSKRLDEVYLALGELALLENKDSKKAFNHWEKGISVSNDPFIREDLTKRINGLKLFSEKILFSDREADNETGLLEVFKTWRVDKDRHYALGLLTTAIEKLENRPDVALMRYYSARIYEELGNIQRADREYQIALRSLYHPGCRKDMILYRLARMHAANKDEKQAKRWYLALVNRYPHSKLSRSAYYWLYKLEEENKVLLKAHHYLDILSQFRSLNPVHREFIEDKLDDVEARMNIEELERLRDLSPGDHSDMPYFIGKILENDLQDFDRAILHYEEFLKTNPPLRRSREVFKKIAELYEKKGDYVNAVRCFDLLLDTYEPSVNNFELIFKIGSLVEDELADDELTEIFYESIAYEYRKVRKVRLFAEGKLRIIDEKRAESTKKPKSKKAIKRIYTEDDELVLEEMEEIIERQIDDLQDFRQAERQLEDLWNDNLESLATFDIMKVLIELNMKQLHDPQKAAEYYEKWLDENQGDPFYKEYTMKLYDHYMDVLRDGDKALRLLEDYIKDHPTTVDNLDIELKIAKSNEFLLKSYDEARRIYQRIIDTRYNDPVIHEAYYRMGFVLRDGFANYNEAIANWEELTSNKFYNNEFADDAQFSIAYTYEVYEKDYGKANTAYNKILSTYPNSPFQQDARDALLRIEGK